MGIISKAKRIVKTVVQKVTGTSPKPLGALYLTPSEIQRAGGVTAPEYNVQSTGPGFSGVVKGGSASTFVSGGGGGGGTTPVQPTPTPTPKPPVPIQPVPVQLVVSQQGVTPQQLQQQRAYQMARKQQPTQQQQFGSFSGKVEQFGAGGRPEQTEYYVGGKETGRFVETPQGTRAVTTTPSKLTFGGGKEVVTFTKQGATQDIYDVPDKVYDIGSVFEGAHSEVESNMNQSQNISAVDYNPYARQQLPAWKRIKLAYQSAPGEPFSIRGGIRGFIESSNIVAEKINFDKLLGKIIPSNVFGYSTKNLLTTPINTKFFEDIAIMTAFNPALATRTEIMSKLNAVIPRDVVSISLQTPAESGGVKTVTTFSTTGKYADESAGVLKSLSVRKGENIITETRGFSELLGRTIRAEGSYGKDLFLNIGKKRTYFRGGQLSRVEQGKGTLNLFEDAGVKVYRDIDIEGAVGKGLVYEPKAELSVNPNVIKLLMKNIDKYTTKSFSFGGKAKFVLGATKSTIGDPLGYAGFVFKTKPVDIIKLGIRGGGGTKSSLEQLYKTGLSDTLATATRMVQRTAPTTLPRTILTPVVSQSLYPQSIYTGTGLYERTGGGQIPGQINRINLNLNLDQFKTTPKLISSLSYGLGEMYKSNQQQIPKNLFKEEQKYNQAQIPILKTDVVQKQRLKTLQLLNLKQIQRQINKNMFVNPPVPRFKTKTPLFPIFKLTSGKGRGSTGKYSVLSKRFGKWFNIGKGLNLNQALGLGRSYTARTLARSFKIQDLLGRTPQIILPSYRKAKRQPGVMVEKSKYALNLPGEINALLGYRRKKLKRNPFNLTRGLRF